MAGIKWLGGQTVLNFNGAGDHLIFNGGFLPPESCTVFVTFRAAPFEGKSNELLSEGGAVPFYIGRQWSNHIRVGDDWENTGVQFPDDGDWHCIAVVIARNANTTTLYVDGEERARLPMAIRCPNGEEFRVGRQYGTYEEYFKGSIAEIVTVKGALRPEEVRLYAGGQLLGVAGEPLRTGTLLRFDLGRMPIRSLGGGTEAIPVGCTFGPAIPAIDPKEPAVEAVRVADGAYGKPLLSRQSVSIENFLYPEVPSNLDIFTSEGYLVGALGALSIIAAPAIGIVIGSTGAGPSSWLNPNDRSHLSRVEFVRSSAPVGIRSEVKFDVLQRDDGRVDFAIQLNNNYGTKFSRSPDWSNQPHFRSLYQDQVLVRIAPLTDSANDVIIVDSGCFPLTNSTEANYSNTIGWSTSAGFSGTTPTGSVGYSVGTTVSESYKDFTVSKQTDPYRQSIDWDASIKKLYWEDGNPAAVIYKQPKDIIMDKMTHQFLLLPPEIATSDLLQQYMATYTSRNTTIGNKSVTFQIEIYQRVLHAETLGKATSAVGGTSMVVPYMVAAVIRCTANLRDRRFSIQNMGVKGRNAKQLASMA